MTLSIHVRFSLPFSGTRASDAITARRRGRTCSRAGCCRSRQTHQRIHAETRLVLSGFVASINWVSVDISAMRTRQPVWPSGSLPTSRLGHLKESRSLRTGRPLNRGSCFSRGGVACQPTNFKDTCEIQSMAVNESLGAVESGKSGTIADFRFTVVAVWLTRALGGSVVVTYSKETVVTFHRITGRKN